MKILDELFFRRSLCTVILWSSFIHAASAQGVPQSNRQDTTVRDESRTCGWSTLLPNTLNDQKRIFGTFPAHFGPRQTLASRACGRVGYNRAGYRGSI